MNIKIFPVITVLGVIPVYLIREGDDYNNYYTNSILSNWGGAAAAHAPWPGGLSMGFCIALNENYAVQVMFSMNNLFRMRYRNQGIWSEWYEK